MRLRATIRLAVWVTVCSLAYLVASYSTFYSGVWHR